MAFASNSSTSIIVAGVHTSSTDDAPDDISKVGENLKTYKTIRISKKFW